MNRGIQLQACNTLLLDRFSSLFHTCKPHASHSAYDEQDAETLGAPNGSLILNHASSCLAKVSLMAHTESKSCHAVHNTARWMVQLNKTVCSPDIAAYNLGNVTRRATRPAL